VHLQPAALLTDGAAVSCSPPLSVRDALAAASGNAIASDRHRLCCLLLCGCTRHYLAILRFKAHMPYVSSCPRRQHDRRPQLQTSHAKPNDEARLTEQHLPPAGQQHVAQSMPLPIAHFIVYRMPNDGRTSVVNRLDSSETMGLLPTEQRGEEYVASASRNRCTCREQQRSIPRAAVPKRTALNCGACH